MSPIRIAWLVGEILSCVASYSLGRVQEARIGAAELAEYKASEIKQSAAIVQAEVQVVTKTEIVYRDRIQKIYVEGKKIELSIPAYVRPADDITFAVNAGFLRVLDSAWSGAAAGPTEDSDREPAGVPLSEIAGVEVDNATSCRAWRSQVTGWKQFYAEQQLAVNGQAGAWFVPWEPETVQ